MAEAGVRYPTVFVVDKETLPPLPPKPGQIHTQQRRNRWIHNTLFLLVCIALCCILLEAYFIYDLYKIRLKPVTSNNTGEVTQASVIEAQKGGPGKKNNGPKKQTTPLIMTPPKPMAHLTAVKEMPNTEGVMQWSDLKPVCQELEYSEGKLVVQKEGYYYIYSKISFSPNRIFIHSVRNLTPRYQGNALELLRDRRYQPNSALKDNLRSSYLGGIFHLNKKDAIFVHVNNSSLVRLQSRDDNFFGMFML